MTARTMRRLAGVAGILVLGAVGTATANPVHSLDDALKLSKEQGLPILVDFGTSW